MNLFKITNYVLIIVVASLFLGCSSFVKENEHEVLRSYEKSNGGDVRYTLLKNIEINKVKVKKGTSVKVILIADEDWIKVYVYKSGEDILKSKRFLVLYLFEDDFPKKKFDRKFFRSKFNEVLRRK